MHVDAVLDWLRDWADHVDWFAFVSIPFFTGIVGWLINWSGLWMLFKPVGFWGFRVPGLREVAGILPRKAAGDPGVDGRWLRLAGHRARAGGQDGQHRGRQGDRQNSARPRSSTPRLEPDQIAEHIVNVFRPDLPDLVDEVMMREHPRLWRDLPRPVRQAVIDRVQAQAAGRGQDDHRRDRRPHRPVCSTPRSW
ncbi:hypothetical protein [Nocardioides convexus]|uniref:hypothetical protein n=1 Tax=Nocardioides convexus TaxID=2712224 RepID=UPI0024182F5B|nr:hypothetical protein [Nocardioides convexus]